MENDGGMRIETRDVTRQKAARLSGVPADSTVGELVQAALASMELPTNDANSRELTYHALLEREGRHLHNSETVADALENDDQIVLQPSIHAGV